LQVTIEEASVLPFFDECCWFHTEAEEIFPCFRCHE
jgi:hypothetical protein